MDENSTITIGDAYRAMFELLEDYWREGGRSEDQISDLLSAMQYGDELGPTKTADPASWQRWITAIAKVRP